MTQEMIGYEKFVYNERY